MKAKLKNVLSGEIFDVESKVEHPASSYGFAVLVDNDGYAVAQENMPLPFWLEFVEIVEE